jgi:hypothetical protein
LYVVYGHGRPYLTHQALDCATGSIYTFTMKLAPNLASAIDSAIGLPNPPDLPAHNSVAT